MIACTRSSLLENIYTQPSVPTAWQKTPRRLPSFLRTTTWMEGQRSEIRPLTTAIMLIPPRELRTLIRPSFDTILMPRSQIPSRDTATLNVGIFSYFHNKTIVTHICFLLRQLLMSMFTSSCPTRRSLRPRASGRRRR